jgi:hypothetical protein
MNKHFYKLYNQMRGLSMSNIFKKTPSVELEAQSSLNGDRVMISLMEKFDVSDEILDAAILNEGATVDLSETNHFNEFLAAGSLVISKEHSDPLYAEYIDLKEQTDTVLKSIKKKYSALVSERSKIAVQRLTSKK